MEVVDSLADTGGQEAGGSTMPLLDEAIMLPHHQEQRQWRSNSKEMVNLRRKYMQLKVNYFLIQNHFDVSNLTILKD